MIRTALIALALAGCTARSPPETSGKLTVAGTGFELATDDGAVLRSADLVGATLEMNVGPGQTAMVRIDKVEPARERPSVQLHTMSVIDAATGKASSLCDADASGRRAAFPVRGRFEADGSYVADEDTWLLTCTSGSQAKCVLWGYDPWARAGGASLAARYEACQHLVRADYDGSGEARTRDGTEIDIWDDIGVQKPTRDPKFVFEAGWGAKGAVCVARTRWPDLLTTEALHESAPRLAGRCDEATARARGAILFTAVRARS